MIVLWSLLCGPFKTQNWRQLNNALSHEAFLLQLELSSTSAAGVW